MVNEKGEVEEKEGGGEEENTHRRQKAFNELHHIPNDKDNFPPDDLLYLFASNNSLIGGKEYKNKMINIRRRYQK